MWFRNLATYRFTEAFELSAADLEEKLQQHPFRNCGAQEASSIGWISPAGKSGHELVFSSQHFHLICLQKQEKVVPGPVIAELLDEKVNQLQEDQSRKIGQKERRRIKDELLFELMPKAFRFSKRTYAYIDRLNGWIIVDAGSSKKAEDLLSYLRKTLGSLPVVPLNANRNPIALMTDWLQNDSLPDDFMVENECELRTPEEEGGIIRCKRHDLTLPEIKNHLEHGKQVSQLALNWSDKLAFQLNDQLLIKRLKFLDILADQRDSIDATDDMERLAADFSIMTEEVSQLLSRLTAMFTQENQHT